MDQHLIRLLRIENPWLGGQPLQPWLERRLPDRILPRRVRVKARNDRVALVIGPRQAGKSTLIWASLSEQGKPVLFLDCEEPSVREWLRSPALFLADLEELASDIPIIFFEELQALDNAGLFLKGLIDRRGCPEIYATGSSSFDLEDATRESLAGRARRFLLLPFSIDEIASSTKGARGLRPLANQEIVERMLVYGSYPKVHLSEQPREELAGLVEAFVIRDASDRFRIRNLAAFRKLLQLAASQIGNICNFSEWAAITRVSNDTIADYCYLLEQTHVLHMVRPFAGGRRSEITRAPKVFFIDNGIRNQLFGGCAPWGQRPDRGPLMENLVFSELRKHLNPLLDNVGYWRTKAGAEVDFVVERQGRLIAVEVKAGDARGKINRSARSFIDAYHPELFLIVNQTSRSEIELGSTRVRFLQSWDLGPALDF